MSAEIQKRIEAVLKRYNEQKVIIARLDRIRGKHLKLVVCTGKRTKTEFQLRSLNIELINNKNQK